MASDSDLRPGNSNQGTQFAAQAMVQSARGQPKWLQVLIGIFTAIILLIALLKLFDVISNFGSLPKCDASSTKNTLSDLNKSNNLNASSYNFIRTVSSGKDEVQCTAGLALRDGKTVEYDYRIYKEPSGTKVQITNWRR